MVQKRGGGIAYTYSRALHSCYRKRLGQTMT
jgi:hypothetical protein